VRVLELRVEVFAHRAVELVAPLRELLELLAVFRADRLRLFAQARRLALLALERGAAGGELVEHVIELAVLALEELVGALDHVAAQPHPRGDRRGRRAARQADAQAIGRLERVRVELDARVGEARIDVGHLLEQAVVRGRDHARARVGERLEDRLRERGALARIGADADLVEHDQRARRRPSRSGEIRHGPRTSTDSARSTARRRCRRALRRGSTRAAAAGTWSPRAWHRERGGLHRHRLAARVRPGDHSTTGRRRPDVVGHRAAWIEARMAQLRRPQAPASPTSGGAARADRARRAPARVEQRERVEPRVELGRGRRGGFRR
jgi:hypothetical protein